MDEADVTELLDCLGQVECGRGWTAAGAWTRCSARRPGPHADLDLVIDRPDFTAAQALLAVRGYAVLRDWLPNAIAYRDAHGSAGRSAPVDPTPDGGGNQIQLGGRSRWHYSAPVNGVIGGRPVFCCPAKDQVLRRFAYPPCPAASDDMRRLGERFGLALPEPFGSV